MVEIEGRRASTLDSTGHVRSLPIRVGKLLLHGLVVTGIFIAYLIVFFSSGLPWQIDFVGFNALVVTFLSFGILEGLVNREVSKILWSTPKKSARMDFLVRGPVLFSLSALIFYLLTLIAGLAGPVFVLSALQLSLLIALWIAGASVFNGLAGLALSRFRFGISTEKQAESIAILGTCPNCKAVYNYLPDHIVEGKAICQNCRRSFRLVAEGPSVR
ncbi:MAG: hypothetical protein C4K47_07525 [Candidatus Thorarchaeota archaeon]|nr:MAG: hypothetical protein C4K47_07525 [Candidatus Thorarchaeota archaeon]